MLELEPLTRGVRSAGRLLSSHCTLLLLLASIALNVVQARRLAAYMPGAPLPLAGSVLPALNLRTVDGRIVPLEFSTQPTVLYYFSPQCGWCEKNWSNIKALSAGIAGRYRIIGISAAPDIASYARDRQLPFEVYTLADPAASKTFHFGATPHTIVVSTRRTVEVAWAGAYTPKIQAEIERKFGIVLPGLGNPQPGTP